VLEYRVSSGEIGFEGEGSFEASGSMSIQRVSEIFSNPVEFDVLELILDAGDISLFGSGEVDASLQGGVGVLRSLELPDVVMSLPPPPGGNSPANFIYGFAAASLDAPAGIERWAALYFATPAEAMSEWIGDSRSTPDGLSLFLELRRLSWEKEGMALSFLGNEVVGSAALHFELVPVPEPESALLLSLGLSFVAMGRRTRSRA